ncbi:hypothetical protein SNK03_007048 [Fusarium graminearum]|uniref:Chromosome 2, complete genome n=2 Tax=Gibberella zeae TaxID=5518 RepID=I1RK38_GIBZE|nr:hypothetical protein FGSG_04226 [Fusarium graminearum PH-1]EYB21490.1 hypothetical protein FG05_04226 [Fusarium graminearum]ESU08900.1 hypothetical protein FGSG_04226 [Fusarium graminearum PH-1]KAI6773608.1 hypothetical protein HG531_000457 [Fusarium graminearum]PCD28119.1 hypothetical protein FGRA07_03258 [Fusarium graminearum]CAF3513212.1 unnamed protein product [Fusarium graminearum]|eukprot:XP_011321399.1 hypothetical protein FGSG_04226 [Fusarium graminearum PH-1]
MSEAREYWGLSCINGGKFYICEDDDTQFIGCCLNDPCGKNNGTCPDGDLRATTFESDKYAKLPAQDCDNSQGVDNWYTCAFTNPPFLGCCSQNACGSGCPRDRLVPAKLSEIENNRLDFLNPRSDESTTASSASETASATASSTSTVNANDDDGLGTGAMAGIAVGASIGGLFVLGLLAWLFWLRPRQKKKKNEKALQAASTASAPGPTMSEQPHSPMGGPIHQGTFAAHSPMSGYQQSFNSTPTVMNPHYSGVSSNDQYQKYSPQFSQSERPQSYAQFSDHGSYANSPGLPPYQQPQMIPVQEMDGTTTARQEMDAGPEHHIQRNPSIGPEILNVQQPKPETK